MRSASTGRPAFPVVEVPETATDGDIRSAIAAIPIVVVHTTHAHEDIPHIFTAHLLASTPS